MICPLSPAHFTALAAFQFSLVLLFLSPQLAPVPLLLFVVLCCVAPLFPRFPFYLPITSRGRKGVMSVALTFDDGPDPAVTPLVLDLLDKYGASATFFVTGTRAQRYPDLVRDILARGHTLGNHSFHHWPFLMLKGKKTLKQEVEATQAVLRQFGVVPLAFRPPVGVTGPHLWRVLLEAGMFCVNFSCRAADRGNRRVYGLAARLLKKVAARDIVLLHDISPRQGTVDDLLREFELLLCGLASSKLEVVPLHRLVHKQVMRRDPDLQPNTARDFYDDLADDYDREQFSSTVSISRRKELELFTVRLPEIFTDADRVLEIGAGTGIFTLTIAAHSRTVLAVDVSGRMMEVLEKKARHEGRGNIATLVADIEKIDLEGEFSVVCAFSSLEYLRDLPALCRRLAQHTAPGGVIYFITARRSVFRLFTQIGNAMRQGLWLGAYSRREMAGMLSSAGFEPVSITEHLLKSWISGGMLLEVIARKAKDMPTGEPAAAVSRCPVW